MHDREIYKKDILRRLKISEGHLKKVIQMVEENKYCIDVLQQASAVKSAIGKVEDLIMDNHLHSCVKRAIEKGENEKEINEIFEVFKKINK